jgi:serine/threonine protein kinase
MVPCLSQVKIGDFGFAKQLAPGRGSMHVKRITHPRWVAPEVSGSLAVIVVQTAVSIHNFAVQERSTACASKTPLQ